jgi:hypothetical protein
MHAGLAWNDAVDIVLNIRYASSLHCCLNGHCTDVVETNRARDEMEVHTASVAIGAMLGAWLGAIPIPLDWDRPWQQWPLTCVYGVLSGSTLGHVAGIAVVAWMKKSKRE